jgi:hypothetical protein
MLDRSIPFGASGLTVRGKFSLASGPNPPAVKTIEARADGRQVVQLGRGVSLVLGSLDDALDRLMDARVVVDGEFRGLGSIEKGLAVICMSNVCTTWALRMRRPRFVAKVVGIESDLPRYVLLSVPRLVGAPRARPESARNRGEAGLVAFVLIEAGQIQCAFCGTEGQVVPEP